MYKRKEGEKMKHKRIKVLVSVFLLLCTLLSAINVQAADGQLGKIVDGSLLTEDLESEGIAQSVRRGAFLSYGSGTIANNGNGTVSITGYTVCYNTCDKVKVTLYLQRLVGGSWVNVATYGPTTATNASYVSASKTYSVSGGYYYRVSGGHVAIDNGSTETVASNSKGIWVD